MKRTCSYTIAILLVVGFLLSSGCGSTVQTRYYALGPITDVGQRQTDTAQQCPLVGIGTVKLPKYLDRPQIATNSGDNEILLSEENRWIEPLSQSFPRVLARNLYSLVCTRNVLIYPWRASVKPDYVVDIEVMRMEGTPATGLFMEARWSVTKSGESSPPWRWSTLKEPTGSNSYEGYVRAHSKATGNLSIEIAKAIEGLSRDVNAIK
ncbi:MAG TPA: hypothetical protein DCR97_01225 [Deltaproteobacteria bacterium]|nr:hypothetical protein [Deltaproteobacteria bacterium]